MESVENFVDQVKKYNSEEFVKEIKELASGELKETLSAACSTPGNIAKEVEEECNKSDPNLVKIFILIGGALTTLAGAGVGLWLGFRK